MPSHVALLRGINLGGHKKVAMADLRAVVASLGHDDVATYIQSGNVVFSTDQTDNAALADAIERAVASQLSVRVAGPGAVPRRPGSGGPGQPLPRRAESARRARRLPAGRALAGDARHPGRGGGEGGGAGQPGHGAVRRGRALYLHTPDGFGRSQLAIELGRRSGPMSARGAGTARNWATVTKLLALCDAAG